MCSRYNNKDTAPNAYKLYNLKQVLKSSEKPVYLSISMFSQYLPKVPSGGRRGLVGARAHRPAGLGPNHGHETAKTRRRPISKTVVQETPVKPKPAQTSHV